MFCPCCFILPTLSNLGIFFKIHPTIYNKSFQDLDIINVMVKLMATKGCKTGVKIESFELKDSFLHILSSQNILRLSSGQRRNVHMSVMKCLYHCF